MEILCWRKCRGGLMLVTMRRSSEKKIAYVKLAFLFLWFSLRRRVTRKTTKRTMWPSPWRSQTQPWTNFLQRYVDVVGATSSSDTVTQNTKASVVPIIVTIYPMVLHAYVNVMIEAQPIRPSGTVSWESLQRSRRALSMGSENNCFDH